MLKRVWWWIESWIFVLLRREPSFLSPDQRRRIQDEVMARVRAGRCPGK